VGSIKRISFKWKENHFHPAEHSIEGVRNMLKSNKLGLVTGAIASVVAMSSCGDSNKGSKVSGLDDPTPKRKDSPSKTSPTNSENNSANNASKINDKSKNVATAINPLSEPDVLSKINFDEALKDINNKSDSSKFTKEDFNNVKNDIPGSLAIAYEKFDNISNSRLKFHLSYSSPITVGFITRIHTNIGALKASDNMMKMSNPELEAGQADARKERGLVEGFNNKFVENKEVYRLAKDFIIALYESDDQKVIKKSLNEVSEKIEKFVEEHKQNIKECELMTNEDGLSARVTQALGGSMLRKEFEKGSIKIEPIWSLTTGAHSDSRKTSFVYNFKNVTGYFAKDNNIDSYKVALAAKSDIGFGVFGSYASRTNSTEFGKFDMSDVECGASQLILKTKNFSLGFNASKTFGIARSLNVLPESYSFYDAQINLESNLSNRFSINTSFGYNSISSFGGKVKIGF
jgi:hypothetical protein